MYLEKVTSANGQSICTLDGVEIPYEAFVEIGDLLYDNDYQITKELSRRVREILDDHGVPMKYIDYNVSQREGKLNEK
jgi:hypothetical protein